jgi:hypothetical protein
MAHTKVAVGVGGTWRAVASVLMVAALVFHGPIANDLNDQMKRIADGAMRWSVVHWIAAAALSLYALTGLVVLTSAWWALAEGKATGFAFFALAVAVIAGNEARSPERATPPWSAWIGMAAGVASFAGWGLGMWFG